MNMNLFMNRTKSKQILKDILPSNLHRNNVVFACIGSDLSIGDSLGPIVGSELERMGYHVIGTLKDPLNGVNLKERLSVFMKDNEKILIAIDAGIGEKKQVGNIQIKKGPINPGAGLGKKLFKVGDYSLTGIVTSATPFEFFNTQTIRLSFVMEMAKQITDEINQYFSGTD